MLSAYFHLWSRFRQKALLYHPDKNSEECATEEFSRVCEAYDVLNDCKIKARIHTRGIAASASKCLTL